MTYERLRKLSSSSEPSLDSISRGQAIEEAVNSLLASITKPFSRTLDVTVGKYRFDGEIAMTRGKTILYDVSFGRLSAFRYEKFIYAASSAFFFKKAYFLMIANDLSKTDVMPLKELAQGLTSGRRVCFIDYETLISLDKFVLKMESENSDKDLKLVKRLFLEELFQSDVIVSEPCFSSALSRALNQYAYKNQGMQRIHLGDERIVQTHPFALSPEEASLYWQKLDELENTVHQLLSQIRSMRNELKSHDIRE
jgi:hypothetical protein